MKKIKEETKNKIKTSLKFCVIIFLIALFSMFPYLNNILIYTHDLGYHLNRINEISNNLNIGIFPTFIHSGLLNNLGYANTLFYPEIFIYLPAIFMSFFKMQVLPAYKLFLIIITFFTFLSMYISSKNIFKKKLVGFLSAILYTFSLYRLTDIYVRGALGEILAFIFLPLIIYGLYEIIFGENKKWWIISIGLMGIVNSHILTFLFIIPVILLICLLNIDIIFKDKKKLINLIIAAAVAVILSIGFIGPMLEQKSNDKFYIDGQSIESAEVVKSRALSLSMVFSSKVVGGYAIDSSNEEGCMSEGIGICLFIFAAFTLFRKLNYKENRFEIQIFLIASFVIFMTTKYFPWEKLSFLAIIQFPFRLNFIAMLLYSFIGANSFYEVIENKRDGMIFACIAVLIFSCYLLGNVNLNFNKAIYTKYEDLVSGIEHETGSSEYLPVNSNVEDLNLYNVNNKDVTYEYSQVGSTITFEYNNQIDDMQINIPLIYYKGYKAYITDEKGTVTDLEISKNEENAHVLVSGNKYLTGTITVKYVPTAITIISYIISYVSFIVLIVYIVIIKKKEIKDNK